MTQVHILILQICENRYHKNSSNWTDYGVAVATKEFPHFSFLGEMSQSLDFLPHSQNYWNLILDKFVKNTLGNLCNYC